MAKYHLEDEDNDMTCGFDFESFIGGFDCQNLATKIVVEDKDDFHFAHLCITHADEVMIGVSKCVV